MTCLRLHLGVRLRDLRGALPGIPAQRPAPLTLQAVAAGTECRSRLDEGVVLPEQPGVDADDRCFVAIHRAAAEEIAAGPKARWQRSVVELAQDAVMRPALAVPMAEPLAQRLPAQVPALRCASVLPRLAKKKPVRELFLLEERQHAGAKAPELPARLRRKPLSSRAPAPVQVCPPPGVDGVQLLRWLARAQAPVFRLALHHGDGEQEQKQAL